MLINKNIHNYAAKFHEPPFNDGDHFTLKNNLLLRYGNSKTFQYFDLRNNLIKKTYKMIFLLPIYTMLVVVIMARPASQKRL